MKTNLPNHHKDLEKLNLNIRDKYRLYLEEMKAYNFFPLPFRVWYSWHTKTALI